MAAADTRVMAAPMNVSDGFKGKFGQTDELRALKKGASMETMVTPITLAPMIIPNG